MVKKILVLENEINRQRRIREIINETLLNAEIHIAKTVGEAYQLLIECTIDFFIVNAILDCENATDTEGIRFVAGMREIPKYSCTPVIIISSLCDPSGYILEELKCLGCLDGNFSKECMVQLLKQASSYEVKCWKEKTLLFRKNRILYPVKTKNIIYMERANNITSIHLTDGSVLDIPYISFARIMYDADSCKLVMCNRSISVNKDYVYAIDLTNRFVILRDDKGMLDLGGTYKKELLSKFAEENGEFLIRKDNVWYVVRIKDLLYVESHGRMLHIHMRDGSTLEVVQKSIKYIVGLAESENLIQCARGLLVNKKYICSMDRKEHCLILKNEMRIKIGGSFYSKIKEMYSAK